MIINKLKAIVDVIAPPSGYKGLFFRSDTGVPAVVDENGVVSDLVIPGDASGVTYTPLEVLDWTDSVDPGNVAEALDDLALRTRSLENNPAGVSDAADVTYTPTTAADWDGDADPGDAQEAFDQLAERVTNLEEAPAVSDASDVTYTPAHPINWTDSEDPGNVDDALDDLASRVQSLEENSGGGATDAENVTYAPGISGDWVQVPDDVEEALDELAGRVIVIESAPPVDASAVTFTPAHPIHWTDSEDPGDVDDALNDLASRTQALEESAGDSIVGTTGSTDNALLRADGTGGSTAQASPVIVGDNGEISGYRGDVRTISGTTGTIDATDTGKIVDTSNGSAVAIEFDNAIPADACGTVMQLGAGQITFSVESGGTLRNRQSHTKCAGQYGVVLWRCIGNSGGSAAEILIGGDTAS